MIDTRMVYKTIVWQAVLVFILSFILGWIFSVRTAISFALGGTLSIVPGLLFARIFLKDSNAAATEKVINTFFYGETVKWIVIIVLFILVFQWKGLQAIPFFLGIIATQLVYWLVFVKDKGPDLDN